MFFGFKLSKQGADFLLGPSFYRYVVGALLAKQLVVQHIPGLDQWTDLLTKPFLPQRVIFLRSKLKVVELPIVSHPP